MENSKKDETGEEARANETDATEASAADQTEQDVLEHSETSEDVEDVAEAEPEDTVEDETGDEAPAVPEDENLDVEPAEAIEPEEPADAPEEAPMPAAEPIIEEKVVEIRKGGIGGLVLGGIVAAALGAGAAYVVLPRIPGLLPAPADEAQNAAIAALEAKTAALESSLAAASAKSASDVAALGSALDAVKAQDPSDRVAELSKALEAAASRIAALESRPVAGSAPSPETMQAVDAALEQLRAQVSNELTRIEAASKAVAATEQSAHAQAAQAVALAALGRVQSALDAGQPYAADLAPIKAASVAIPPALETHAKQGVPTLAALQEAFPDAARAALSASIDQETPDDTQGKIGAFLRKQLGVRSLEPRAGDDPDAVLSRAEDALRQGDLSATLAQLDTLNGPAAEHMVDWRAMAQVRADAVAALAQLSQDLSE